MHKYDIFVLGGILNAARSAAEAVRCLISRNAAIYERIIMNRDEFMALTEEEQTAFLLAEEGNAAAAADLEAERDSLRSENEALRSAAEENAKELKKTKELNFTLARQVSTGERSQRQSAEELIHDMFKRG